MFSYLKISQSRGFSQLRFGLGWPGQRGGAKIRSESPCQRSANKQKGRCHLFMGVDPLAPSQAIISSPPSPKSRKELSCQAGPFFKPGLVTKPKTYYATSFDNNPRSNCSVAAKKCGSLAKIKLS